MSHVLQMSSSHAGLAGRGGGVTKEGFGVNDGAMQLRSSEHTSSSWQREVT